MVSIVSVRFLSPCFIMKYQNAKIRFDIDYEPLLDVSLQTESLYLNHIGISWISPWITHSYNCFAHRM